MTKPMTKLRRSAVRNLLVCGIAIFVLPFFHLTDAQAQLVPGSMNHQGILFDAGGFPIADDNYTLVFNIYSLEIGGDHLWGPQVFDGTVGPGKSPRVPVVDGRFNVVLGPSDTAGRSLLDAIQLASTTGGSAFLEVSSPDVGDTVPKARGPRQRLLNTVYAFQAFNGAHPGTIIMWNRGFVPPGWAVCDGTNGTPDLRGRFIKGATGIGPAFYAAGGASVHGHGTAAHSHSQTHTHGIAHTHTQSAHSHSADPPSTSTSTYDPPNINNETTNGAVSRPVAKTHSHTVDVASHTSGTTGYTTNSPAVNSGSASSSTTGSTSQGSGTGNHEPPHLTLMFLMKL
jgi:hypothetical protein